MDSTDAAVLLVRVIVGGALIVSVGCLLYYAVVPALAWLSNRLSS